MNHALAPADVILVLGSHDLRVAERGAELLLQRIRVYPPKGFQIEQEIPGEVWGAYERLVALGYTDNLVKE